ncbi:MAG: cobyrinate a,c-diamide synthase, partial [Rhodospirillaceae bacterium]|nr:cobyrinate a,c-diamide synthase [Rhodospirillaceae bacterium]
MTDNAAGLIIAAPSSGSGKTVVTLGLLRQFARTGVAVSSAKVGPDYIDPAFHAIATGRPCRNLDTWAMRPATLSSAIETLADDGPIVCEGVMGLFDGARGVSGEADGSSAALSRLTGWPVVLVVDASAQAASAAAVVRGFATHDAEVPIAGVIFNRVGSDAHAAILIEATAAAFPNLPVLGCLPRLEGMNLPERHLGLVQAIEHPDLPGFMDCAADWVAAHLDLDRLQNLFTPAHTADNDGALVPPLP